MEHGGSASTSTPRPGNSNSQWFCHVCQADFVLTSDQLARNATPACPQCQGEFVEQTAESIDDPHEFDRVQNNPFAFFGMPGQAGPSGDMGGGGAQQGQTAALSGPFAAFFQQMMGGAMQPAHQDQQGPSAALSSDQRAASTPPTPARAAAQAAEMRAAGLPVQAGESSSSQSTSSSSGVYRSGATTFIWNTANNSNRGPPRASASPQSPQASSSSIPPGQNEGEGQEEVPVRNLASFLSEAFGGPLQQQRQGQQGQTSSLQEGAAQVPEGQAGQNRPLQGDPLGSFLAQLASGMGVPLGGNGDDNGGNSQGQGPQAAGQPRGGARMFMTNPNGGPIMTFSFNTGHGAQGGVEGGPAGVLPFLPFMLGGAGGGPNPGQMGDYVFSQGALDNIITELMNQANGRYGPQRASEEIINGLPKVTMTKELLANDSIQDCAVCKDNFEEIDEALTLPCHHLFHGDCIKPWLERSGTCPVCRYQLVEQPEPPRAAGEAPTNTQSESQTPLSPVSPTSARSPAIEGGSTMPGGFGGFPFGRILSSIGNFVTGGSSSGSTSQQEHQPQPHQREDGGTQGRPDRQEPQGQPDMDLDLD